jgi:colanic acid biosynthesis glycosyl transferase WcaI
MRVAVISVNYSPELTGISVYSTGMSEHLARAGFEVDCYTAFSHYPRWAKAPADQWRLFRREEKAGVSVRRHYIYVPAKLSALRRMLFELSFVFSTTLGYAFGPRADCTVIVSPPLFLGIPIALLAKLKGSMSVFHVQDLQPDAAVDLGMLRRGNFTNLLFFLERQTYRLCDQVSTISRSMMKRIVSKGVPASKMFLFRNWANNEAVVPLQRNTSIRRAWNLGQRFVVLYSGNMGVKQGLESLLDCAERLRRYPDIAILVVGDGGEKNALVIQARRRGLDNLLFKPLQPMRRLSRLLASADVSVIPQKVGVTDIVLPSKLGNLMASARPMVVAATADTELGRIVRDDACCGLLVRPGDGAQMAEAILNLRADPGLRERFGSNGRAYMEQNLTSQVVLDRFAQTLRAMVVDHQSGATAYETA